MPKIVILTGPPGAGKSTIGKLLAEKIMNSAKISTDDLRDLMLNGRANKNDPLWEKQLTEAAENACILAERFYKTGFNVFLDDVICIPERMKTYQKFLRKYKPIFILLLPSKEVVKKRDLERGEWALKERAMYLYDKLVDFNKVEKSFIVIDSSKQTAQETASEITKRLGF